MKTIELKPTRLSIPNGTDFNSICDYLPIESSKYQIFLHDEIIQPPLLLGIKQGDLERRLFTLGNISMTKGKAKSRKSFLMSLLIASTICNEDIFMDFFHSPMKGAGAILIDTEQSPYDVQRVAKRIPRMIDRMPDNLFIYTLRTADTSLRLDEVERAVKRHEGNFKLLVIDGAADLVMDINDRAECVIVITKLMQWSTEFDIHIHVVLHENKGGSTEARGHIGTELVNKCETVLQAKKEERDLTKITGEYTRGRGFEPFYFGVDENGLPFLNDFIAPQNNSNKKKAPSPTDFEPQIHIETLNTYFNINESFKVGEAREKIRLAFKESHDIDVSRDVVKTFVTYYTSKKYFKDIRQSPTDPTAELKYTAPETVKISGYNYDSTLHNEPVE